MTINKLTAEVREARSLESFLNTQIIRHNFFKRIFDILFSFCALLAGLPFYLIIAIAIKIDSPGPIFYSSLRIGRGGKKIHCWKFRSMYQDAEKKLAQLLNDNPAMREEWEAYFKIKDDPRITFLGKFLRKTSLDEIPQFWNVLIGDLSIVGPRPVTEEEVIKYYQEKTSKILAIRPGLTGLWQTSGRNLLPWNKRVILEESYVENRSFFLDLRLIFKTIRMMIFPRGAY